MVLTSDKPDLIPFPALIADIGGTHARFGLMSDETSAMQPLPVVKTKAFPSLDEAIQEAALNHAGEHPRAAVLAVAGPVRGDTIPLTNCPWIVEPQRLIEKFGFEVVVVLNDFEAQALSLPSLLPSDLELIGDVTHNQHATKLVVGPGTGLGAATLVFAHNTWVPLPGEGGHINFGPIDDLDFDIWRIMEPTHGRLSAETFLCGPGLIRLYQALCVLGDKPASFTKPAEIAQAALDKSDTLASQTLDLFCAYLGRFAGDMALFTMAKGGVYLAGGISPQITPLLKNGNFRKAFDAKAPHGDLLQKIATSVMTHSNPALEGLAAYARAPTRFALNLNGRRWAP